MSIIGRNTKDGASFGTAEHYALYQSFTTDGTGGTGGKLHAYVKNSDSVNAHNLQMAIYSDDAVNDLPETPALAAINISVPAGTDGEVNGNYAATLAPNTKYWIIALAADYAIELYFLSAGSGNSGYYGVGGDNIPNPFGDSATSEREYAYDFWADYTYSAQDRIIVIDENVGINEGPFVKKESPMFGNTGADGVFLGLGTRI